MFIRGWFLHLLEKLGVVEMAYLYMATWSFNTYSYQIYLLLSCQLKVFFLSAYYVSDTKMN